MEPKKYFIAYVWSEPGREGWNYKNLLIDESPLQWLAETRTLNEIYVLLFWAEITDKEYEQYEGSVCFAK